MRLSENVKWLVRRLLKRRGLVIRNQPILIDFLQSREVGLVIDVGANVGQFGSELRRWGYRGLIKSFEPGVDAYAQLSENVLHDPLWTTDRRGLGAAMGTATLSVTKSTVFSSMLIHSSAMLSYGDDTTIVGREEITLTTLDEVLKCCPNVPTFIKIDTQGFEQQVLSGLKDMDERVCGFQIELPAIHLYQNTWLFHDAVAFMEQRGYKISQLAAVNHLKDDPVSATEFDCIFSKTSHPRLGEPTLR